MSKIIQCQLYFKYDIICFLHLQIQIAEESEHWRICAPSCFPEATAVL